MKTQVYRFSVDDKSGAFQKRLRHSTHYASPDSIAGAFGPCVSNRKNVRAQPGDKNASLDHRFLTPSVDVRKQCENASVDAMLFVRFPATKNGGFQKRIMWIRPKSLISQHVMVLVCDTMIDEEI